MWKSGGVMGHYAGSMPWKGLLCGQTLHGVVCIRGRATVHPPVQICQRTANFVGAQQRGKTSLDFVFVAVTEGLAPREIKINHL